MSSSPAAKRSLKPSPIAPSAQQNSAFTSSAELPPLQPATATDQQGRGPDSLVTQLQSAAHVNTKKRKSVSLAQEQMAGPAAPAPSAQDAQVEPIAQEPKAKKSRTNTPWTPAEEQRLKTMRDAGNSWSEIAKTFPQRTEGSVKKHWYKDMHYAEFAEDESAALLAAIKEYDQNKWKVIGQKVGKPAKACEQYAKEHFGGKA
ncbi:hypothetical protein M011DRAFT_344145 [Sporormia fimetaria CBS 119925]|uniref:Uncharacterized protein n=1 Tax=Sporormia fimetaria CBS 119925 TaxID=1340428 RepID=A0A6A6VFG0_9PLEO|nr:hypothetical protein M011DRAFT_344145 [Sporormia fimetaria CBS 119925]